ncbi:hypothetical protein F5883DRAFT_690054 [Diaporthe sp. PMI_573]|nr:hypothetical protein F5883DRAFT_690054 [Diaporthaceae sp. PMI_573]
MLYLDQPSSFEQTWPWRSYVIYQYFYQVFLLAANFFISMSDYTVEYLGLNLDAVFLLHPFTTYITILLHMQAEFIFKFWYPEDWSNRQRKATVLHISVYSQTLIYASGDWSQVSLRVPAITNTVDRVWTAIPPQCVLLGSKVVR